MKAFFSLVVLIVLALIIYAYFYNSRTHPAEPPAPATAQTTSLQSAVPQQPGQTEQAAAVPSPAAQSVESRIRAVAAQTGVTIGSLQTSGKEIRVQVDWVGDVASVGGDFVEQVLRQGIARDFEEVPKASRRWYDDGGRSHFTQSFVLKL